MQYIRILIFSLCVMIFLPTSAQSLDAYFSSADAIFKEYVKNGLIDYEKLVDNKLLETMIINIGEIDLTNADAITKQAFYINAYNLIVMKGIAEHYPLKSVLDESGFFKSRKWKVAGEQLTLESLEKNKLLKIYKDPRFHFVLVCAAISCPPITNFAYTPTELEQQLEKQTKKAINNPIFTKINADGSVSISKIFDWYKKDFDPNGVPAFLNKYNSKIKLNSSIDYYEYNWKLNDGGKSTGAVEKTESLSNIASNNIPSVDPSANRYVVSSTIPKKGIELKVFNNLYSQKTGPGNGEDLTDRSTFFSSTFSALYGLSDRVNIGFDVRYRRVHNEGLPVSQFSVFGGEDVRQGVTSIGPKIRWAPTSALPNFSIQSAFGFAIGTDLEGNDSEPYIDWNGASWLTQFFNDVTLSSYFSFFQEIDFILEDIGNSDDGALNRISTPVTVALNYFPEPNTSLYAIAGFSPFYTPNFDWFAQAGLGAKYQISRSFELELLYTYFTNDFLQEVDGRASTLNFGIRYSSKRRN